MSIKPAGLLASLIVLTNGLAANALQPLPASAPLPKTLPGLVSRRIQMDLAQRLNVSPQDIVIKKATPQSWHDRCLELAKPDESCTQGTTKGWQVEVNSPQQNWTYRSDRTASLLRLEPFNNNLNQSDFSTDTSQTLLQTVSQQIQHPAEDLQIAQVQAATWDNCLGLATSDRVCTPSATPGFKVIVTEAPSDDVNTLYKYTQHQERAFRREWVYHLSADAVQVAQNDTASDLKGKVSSWLNDSNNNLQPIDSTVVFQLIADRATITLSTDGELSYEFLDDSSKDNIAAETMSRQIPPNRVAFFETLLQQQRFSNFDRMSYGNEDPHTAIDGSFTVRTSDATVRVSAAEEDLPRDLRVVLDAWRGLAG